MSSVVSPSTANSSDELPPFPVRRFTVEEYYELGRMDFFGEDADKVELLQGYIVPKMVKYPQHETVLYRLFQLLQPLVPQDSAPEPDIFITCGTIGDYANRHPRGHEIGLIIEVADSSIKRDRSKAEVYGNAGVPDYWIVNIRERSVEIHEQPGRGVDGKLTYTSRRVIAADETLTLLLDGVALGSARLSQFLPPVASELPTDPT